jgi:hypothetical protein
LWLEHETSGTSSGLPIQSIWLSVFTFLAHLHLFNLIWSLRDDVTSQLPSFLAQLPVLTHFALFFKLLADKALPAVASDTLAICKALQASILCPATREFSLELLLSSINDVRFVLLPCRGWLNETRGGNDF